MLRAPLTAARLVVVFDAAVARDLEREFPGIGVEVATIGVQGCGGAGVQRCRGAGVRFGVVEASDPERIERAARRRWMASMRANSAASRWIAL